MNKCFNRLRFIVIFAILLIIFCWSSSATTLNQSELLFDKDLKARCGLYSLYYALALSGKNINLSNVKELLPFELNKGLTVYELEQALTRVGMKVSTHSSSFHDFCSNPGKIGIVFSPGEGDNKSKGHIYTIRSLDASEVQIFDFPFSPNVIQIPDQILAEPRTIILIENMSTNPKSKWKYFVDLFFSYLFYIGILGSLFCTFRFFQKCYR